jgi:xanthine dehydrogenase accessory factor
MTELAAEGWPFVVATIVEAKGSSPRGVGAKMLIMADGTTLESIGGGVLEARVIHDAGAVLKSGVSRVESYQLRDEGEQALGSLCGGEVTVFYEVHGSERTLLVVGGGHVGQSLCRCAKLLDFRVTVVDSRADVLTEERFPGADELVLAQPEQIGELCRIDERTRVVIVTHSHVHDEQALVATVASTAAYIGMIGSARKVRTIMANLREKGVPAAQLDRVRSPIGLDIGAQTPAELALCILAEIVADSYGKLPHPPASAVEPTSADDGSV